MSEIVEGCMAIVTGDPESPNTGKIVEVGKFVDSPGLQRHHDGDIVLYIKNCWEVSQGMACSISEGDVRNFFFMTDDRLQRIDDINIETTNEQEKEVENV